MILTTKQPQSAISVPITSNVTKVYSFEVFLKPSDSGLSKPSKVQAQQIRTISKKRISGQCQGRPKEDLMQLVESAIRLRLAI